MNNEKVIAVELDTYDKDIENDLGHINEEQQFMINAQRSLRDALVLGMDHSVDIEGAKE